MIVRNIFQEQLFPKLHEQFVNEPGCSPRMLEQNSKVINKWLCEQNIKTSDPHGHKTPQISFLLGTQSQSSKRV